MCKDDMKKAQRTRQAIHSQVRTLPYKFYYVSGNHVPAGKPKIQREIFCLTDH